MNAFKHPLDWVIMVDPNTRVFDNRTDNLRITEDGELRVVEEGEARQVE